ncbi:histidine phosphatase family protein [Chitinibacter bivalviorum]|uniref:Histidine phosphatase family protein n=1 Tax=Chitinibacter bivalviorum TaxID=2739434 RepID=A0A7H9BNB4_9NEIS|nr:histidine phosphatase family protein [Chitinibacter bivalviorum]QLG88884.1 histidine phosphatase family protein [Chitinibacter bivalviorum]
MPFRLTLIRHGEAESAQNAVFGQSNPPLSSLGRAQMLARWQMLSAQPVDAIASSTLARCADFALDCAQQLQVPLHLDHGFQEIHLGSIDGKAKSEWTSEDHTHWDAWQANPQLSPLPAGENWLQFQHRVISALDSWFSQGEAEHRVLIAHQGTIKAILLAAFGLPAERHQQFWLATAGSVTLWWDEHYPPMLLELSNTLAAD